MAAGTNAPATMMTMAAENDFPIGGLWAEFSEGGCRS